MPAIDTFGKRREIPWCSCYCFWIIYIHYTVFANLMHTHTHTHFPFLCPIRFDSFGCLHWIWCRRRRRRNRRRFRCCRYSGIISSYHDELISFYNDTTYIYWVSIVHTANHPQQFTQTIWICIYMFKYMNIGEPSCCSCSGARCVAATLIGWACMLGCKYKHEFEYRFLISIRHLAK